MHIIMHSFLKAEPEWWFKKKDMESWKAKSFVHKWNLNQLISQMERMKWCPIEAGVL